MVQDRDHNSGLCCVRFHCFLYFFDRSCNSLGGEKKANLLFTSLLNDLWVVRVSNAVKCLIAVRSWGWEKGLYFANGNFQESFWRGWGREEVPGSGAGWAGPAVPGSGAVTGTGHWGTAREPPPAWAVPPLPGHTAPDIGPRLVCSRAALALAPTFYQAEGLLSLWCPAAAWENGGFRF